MSSKSANCTFACGNRTAGIPSVPVSWRAAARSLAGAAALLAFGLLLLTPPLWARSSTGDALPTIALAQLPPEARHTLRLICSGGPFPYERDGVVFRNFERLLPQKERGYYREYTVKTPGLTHRGARRIVAGRGGELYYTDDHYRSFRRILE